MASGSGGEPDTGSGGASNPGSGGAGPGPGWGLDAGPMENLTVVGGCSCTTAGDGQGWPWSGAALWSGALALFASARRRPRR
jgi:MYXO-CTERM domain-containing protein